MSTTTRILSGYEPASVLSFFEDICAIPHVSGDEGAIADYIEAFAKARGLSCCRDAVHNVFIKLPANEGHESAPAVMLQGHTDMVCAVAPGSGYRPDTDPITALVEDGMFEENIMYPVALYSEMLWDCGADIKTMMSEVALRNYVTFA